MRSTRLQAIDRSEPVQIKIKNPSAASKTSQDKWSFKHWLTCGLAATGPALGAALAAPNSRPTRSSNDPWEFAVRQLEPQPASLSEDTWACGHHDNTTGPHLVPLPTQEIVRSHRALQAVLGDVVWRSCHASSDPLTLTYAFDRVNAGFDDYLRDKGGTQSPMSPALRTHVRDILRQISDYSNVRFVEVDTKLANVNYAVADALGGLAGGCWKTKPSDSHTSVVVVASDFEYSRFSLAHETGHAVGGFKEAHDHRGRPAALPFPPWYDHKLHTAMSYTLHPFQYDDLSFSLSGPIDLAAYAYLYGLNPALAGDTEHLIRDDFGIVGIHDSDGQNTMTAEDSRPVILSLTSRISARVGRSIVTVSPTSVFQRANATQTPAAMFFGNDYDNIFLGGSDANVFHVGGGRNFVRAGACGAIVTANNTQQTTVAGFVSSTMHLAHQGAIQSVQQNVCGADTCIVINGQTTVVLQDVQLTKTLSVQPDAPEYVHLSACPRPLSSKMLHATVPSLAGLALVWGIRRYVNAEVKKLAQRSAAPLHDSHSA